LICSGLLFPIAVYTYCTGLVKNVHVNPGFEVLKQRYAGRLRDRQHRYWDLKEERHLGGLVVSDALSRRSGSHLFRS
jgi:hypothetical protein